MKVAPNSPNLGKKEGKETKDYPFIYIRTQIYLV